MQSNSLIFLFTVTLLISCIGTAWASSEQGWCGSTMEDTVLQFAPTEDEVTINNTKSFLDLSKVKSDSRNPYGKNSIVHTFGLAHREIRLDQETELKVQVNPATNQVCLWYNRVNIAIQSKPKIFIASEYVPGSCHYQEVFRHEMEHIMVDREVTNEYLKILADRLRSQLSARQLYGPVDLAEQDGVVKEMQARVGTLVKEISRNMKAERDARQAKVDSLGSYEKSAKFLTDICDKRNPDIALQRDRLLKQYVR